MKGGKRCGANKWKKIEENLEKIEAWIIQGISEREVAASLGIAYSTFREYKKSKSALSETIEKAKLKRKEANGIVEQALYLKATGYNATETRAVKCKEEWYDEKGKKHTKEHVELVEETVHIPAEFAAQKFWLMNKEKTKWKDNPHKVDNDKKLLKLKEKAAEGSEW